MLRSAAMVLALAALGGCGPLAGEGTDDSSDGASDASSHGDSDSVSGTSGLDSDAAGSSGGCDSACSGEGGTSAGGVEVCDDGIDNDGDDAPDCADTDCQQDAACTEGATFRIATWNILRVDPVGSPAHDALVAIVQRLDADVLCLQEVGEGEESALQALAEAGGYAHGLLAPASGPDGTGIANACMSRTPIVESSYLWSNWISSDRSARDLTRPFVRLRMQVPGSSRFISVLSAHMKAGGDDVDRFRRMVESIRMAQAAQGELELYPDNAVVVLGDLNDGPDPDPVTFSALPSGLPNFYTLGNDIQLPFTYAPAQPLLDADMVRVEARWEDSFEQETFIPYGSRLDYIYVRGAALGPSEVYEACNDDGVDDEPLGDVLSKAGDPLQCGLSEIASDHRPVVVDLHIQ